MNMKLYVWEGALPAHSCAVVFALAASAEQAREAIIERAGIAIDKYRQWRKANRNVKNPAEITWCANLGGNHQLMMDLQLEPDEYTDLAGFVFHN